MAVKNKGKYYSPVYVPKKSAAKIKKERLIRRCVLAVMSLSVLAVTFVLINSNHVKSSSLVAQAAADKLFSGITTYPRIVDDQNPLSRSYVPSNLVSLNTLPNGQSVYMRADAAKQFLDMVSDMSVEGMAVIPVTGYVSYDEQSTLVENSVDKFIAEGYSSYEAQEKASYELAAPGESELQLGTSIDVSTELDSVEKFSFTDQYSWICANACKYGFVVRSSSQPWRLRYVGRDAAARMQSAGCYLDEYVSRVKLENPSAREEAY